MELENPEYYNELGEKSLKEGDLRSAYKHFSWAVIIGSPDGPEYYDSANKENKINCKHHFAAYFNKAMVLNKFTFNLHSGILSTALEVIEIVLKNDPLYPGAKDLKEELLKEQTRTEVSSDGVKIIYPFINAKLNGKSIHKNAKGDIIQETHWIDDVKEGPERHYYSNGQLEMEIEYKNGKEVDQVIQTYNESGNLHARTTTTKNGMGNGIQTFFYENGKIKSETMWVDDEKLGPFKEYDIEGRLIEEGENKKDKLIEDYNLQELIDLLRNNPELKIEAMIHEEQRGAFQVYDEKEYENGSSPYTLIDSSNEIYNDISDDDGDIITIEYNEVGDELIELNTDHYNYEYNKEDIDLAKKVYGSDFEEWIKFEIDINWLIEEIEEYYEKEDRLEKSIEDFRDEAWSDYTPPEAIVEHTLSGSEIDSGIGTTTGKNDISWSCTNEFRCSYIDLKLI
jgi:antitoxin component YwqK of YwqJK toxin-antitoxin module